MKSNHYNREAGNRPLPICPNCGNTAHEAVTRYGLRNSCCGLHSWDRHPLVSPSTHEARSAAHKVFDRLWRNTPITRSRAYKMLAEEMGMTREECHIKFMDEETAKQVPAATERIWRRIHDEFSLTELDVD